MLEVRLTCRLQFLFDLFRKRGPSQASGGWGLGTSLRSRLSCCSLVRGCACCSPSVSLSSCPNTPQTKLYQFFVICPKIYLQILFLLLDYLLFDQMKRVNFVQKLKRKVKVYFSLLHFCQHSTLKQQQTLLAASTKLNFKFCKT